MKSCFAPKNLLNPCPCNSLISSSGLSCFPSAVSTKSLGCGRRQDRNIWSPPLCWQISYLLSLAWLSESHTQTWTPRRSAKQRDIRAMTWGGVGGVVKFSSINGTEFFCASVSISTLPVPGTSRPSTGRGISILFTWPYLLHSSRTSSTISSYSSSSSSSSGDTMFIRHSTSVGMPPIWFMELFIRPGTCSVTGVWLIPGWSRRHNKRREGEQDRNHSGLVL